MAVVGLCHRVWWGGGLKRCTCHCNRLIMACGAGRLVRIVSLPTLPAGREACGLCSLRLNDSQLPRRRSLQLPPILSSRFTDSLSAHDKWQNHPNLRPLTTTWLPIAHTLPTVLKAGIHLAKLHETKQNLFWRHLVLHFGGYVSHCYMNVVVCTC